MKTAVASAFLVLWMAGELMGGQSPPQRFVPELARPSDLTVRLDPVGQIPTRTNPTSPAVAGNELLLVDEGGYIYRWEGTIARAVFTPKAVPAGLSLFGPEPLLNVAANPSGSHVYVVFVSNRLPSGVPQLRSVRDPDAWYVVYEYAYQDGELLRPRPVIALQARHDGHLGGGLTVVADGVLLFAVGDNGDSYEDGRDYSQAGTSHLSKIVRIDIARNQASFVARGVRNAQRLVVTGEGDDARLMFIDDGGWVAEELNGIRLRELLTANPPVNFGWGRHEDGRSREGTFYIDQLGNSVGKIPAAEPGFAEPIADFGRVTTEPFGGSGPVISQRSFTRITALFGDLVGGAVFAITGPLSQTRQEVFHVRLVDEQGRTITLKGLSGGVRPDPRFFNYPDGTAGVLIESTGQFYRLTEVTAG